MITYFLLTYHSLLQSKPANPPSHTDHLSSLAVGYHWYYRPTSLPLSSQRNGR